MNRKREQQQQPEPDIKLYFNQSISVSEDELLFCRVIGMYEGTKPATVARRFFVRGLAAFLQDHQLNLPKPEPVIQRDMVEIMRKDPFRECYDIAVRHLRQPSRVEKKARHSSG